MANGRTQQRCKCESSQQDDHCKVLVRERCLDNDSTRSDLLVERFRGVIWGIVKQRLRFRSLEDQKDAMQHALTRIFAEKLCLWLGLAPFCHWVRVVAYRAAIEWHRRNPPWHSIEGENALPGGENDPDDSPACQECINRSVATFEPVDQFIFKRRYHDEPPATVAQVAEELGVTVKTVFNHWASMRQRLRQACENECFPK